MKVDSLPFGVEFIMYSGQSKYDVNETQEELRLKGYFKYNEYAYKVVKPILSKSDAGVPVYTLWKDYQQLAADLVIELGLSTSKRKQVGLKDVQGCVRHILVNRWWLGMKHRIGKTKRDFNKKTQKWRVPDEPNAMMKLAMR